MKITHSAESTQPAWAHLAVARCHIIETQAQWNPRLHKTGSVHNVDFTYIVFSRVSAKHVLITFVMSPPQREGDPMTPASEYPMSVAPPIGPV
jgi:hypothetical protein